MNWSVLLIAFLLSVMAGGWLDARLAQGGNWTRVGRMTRASLALPMVILLASLAGIAWTIVSGPGTGENMTDLAVAVMLSIGLLFALVSFAGGLLGAALAERKRQQ